MKTMLIALATLVWAQAAAAEPVEAWKVDDIPWQSAAPNGTRYALLEGDRGRPAPFTYAFFIPAGVWDGPHWHSQTARVFVAKGALSIGYGDTPDHSMARRYPAGSYVLVPGGQHHFDGADEETVIIGVASGP